MNCMKSRQSGEVQHAHYPLMAAPIEARPPKKKEKEAAPAKREREGESSVTKHLIRWEEGDQIQPSRRCEGVAGKSAVDPSSRQKRRDRSE
ncbi:hypothetical protein GW17_00007692 [Ensete ventricosum]|nr:hypothetical protein GW17_00007692 [Ensete ventricosum]